jgi:hypothetical protein
MKTGSIIVIVIFAMVCFLFAFHFYLLDGLDGFIRSRLFTDDTVYAVGYSDSAFRFVRVGMSKSDVEDLLGPAIDEPSTDDGICIERWSKSAHDGSFRERVVHFKDDKVVAKISDFYVD